MAKEAQKTVEQLQEELAAATATIAQLEQVVNEQSAELEKLGAEKKHNAKVVTIDKKKYKVLATKCVLKVDGVMTAVDVLSLGKKENAALAKALLEKEGQAVLEEV